MHCDPVVYSVNCRIHQSQLIFNHYFLVIQESQPEDISDCLDINHQQENK